MSGNAEAVGESVPDYSDYTQEQVLYAAAVFTLTPSDVRWVDVRTLADRQRDAVAAFEARLAAGAAR